MFRTNRSKKNLYKWDVIIITLTIIAGTHTFTDLTGKFRQALMDSTQRRMKYKIDGCEFTKRRFDRVTITKEGHIQRDPMRILPVGRSGYTWTVTQPTGSLKTVLAVYLMCRTVQRGGNIEANFSFKYMKHNIGKPREEWTPSIYSIEDITNAKNTRLTIDDIKGTIDRWQAKEADIVAMAANLGRKESVDLDITTQGVTNFVPPNIRRIATGYMIPYCTIRDQRVFSPDGKGFPIEAQIISLIPGDMSVGDVFAGFGFLNGDIPDGKTFYPTKELLDSYKTMEHAQGLKVSNEDSKVSNSLKEPYSGYNNEMFVNADLKLYKGQLRHLSFESPNEHATDQLFITSNKTWYIDTVSCRKHGGYYELQTSHKDLSKFNDNNDNRLFAFNWQGNVRYLYVKHVLGTLGNARLTKELRKKMCSGNVFFERIEA